MLIAAPAVAQTPDGETPANEGVCDVLVNHTPGLYGLCIAYCEAHDADLISPAGDLDQLDVPNRKILDNYRKKMRAGDPDMPCVQDPCPCWSADELASIDGVLRSGAALVTFRCVREDVGLGTFVQAASQGNVFPRENRVAQTITTAGGPACVYVDEARDVFGAIIPPRTVRFLQVTEEEQSVCRGQILTHCDAQGL